MTAVTTSSRASSHSQQMIHQAMSLCRRHQQPLSILAIRFQELASIKADIGAERIQRLLAQVLHQMHATKRCEDGLVSCQSGQSLFVVLPATAVDGAMAMAQRLQQWFSSQEFELDEFCISLPTRIGVHCANQQEEEGVVQLLNRAFNTLEDTTDTSQIALSGSARKQLVALQSAPEATGQLSRQLLELASGANQASLMEALSPALSVLDERLRLQLVDQLLEASTQAKAI
ncbi:MAG: diguanylate cyclase [Alcanivorax sp.]|uniref:diguanylate cyclase n=1 Tax=Alcanivorax sp. TaxID=1872427 RepID=UPI003DA78478